jgi:uncharacterized protein (DUF1330 family)
MSTPAYLVVQGKVTDLEGFKAYNAALPPIYKTFGGHYITVAPAPKVEIAEGEARNESILIAKFPSKEAAWGFWNIRLQRSSAKARVSFTSPCSKAFPAPDRADTQHRG